jgi:hypothetical protein
MLEPQELRDPFRSDEERAAGIVKLIETDQRIQALLIAGRNTNDLLPPEIRRILLPQARRDNETPEPRLARWVTLFGDDIETIHDTRSRVVHGVRASDSEIRGAIWLGEQLLELLIGGQR